MPLRFSNILRSERRSGAACVSISVQVYLQTIVVGKHHVSSADELSVTRISATDHGPLVETREHRTDPPEISSDSSDWFP